MGQFRKVLFWSAGRPGGLEKWRIRLSQLPTWSLSWSWLKLSLAKTEHDVPYFGSPDNNKSIISTKYAVTLTTLNDAMYLYSQLYLLYCQLLIIYIPNYIIIIILSFIFPIILLLLYYYSYSQLYFYYYIIIHIPNYNLFRCLFFFSNVDLCDLLIKSHMWPYDQYDDVLLLLPYQVVAMIKVSIYNPAKDPGYKNI